MNVGISDPVHSDPALSGGLESISPEVIARLSEPNLPRWLMHYAGDVAVIALTMYAAHAIHTVWAYFLAVFLVGTRQQALAVLGHEGVHRVCSRNRVLNEVVPRVLCFWPLGGGFDEYRANHVAHHRHLNTPDDPEMRWRSAGAPTWDLPVSRKRVALRFVGDLLGFGIPELIRLIRHDGPKTVATLAGPVLLQGSAFLLAWTYGFLWVLAIWYAALYTSFVAVFRLRCFMEHLGTTETHRVHLNAWQRWLIAPHNIWVHWEHHRWWFLPFWSLTEVRKLVGGVPVISMGELFRHYEQCPPHQSGVPTRAAVSAATPS